METPKQPPIEEVVRELEQPLLDYLERYVGERALAEDLRQETLARIARGLTSFAGRSSIKTWAFAIANRVTADYYRRRGRNARTLELAKAFELTDPAPDIDMQLIDSQMKQCVRELADVLPEAYRTALVSHDLEERSLEQTAEVCECSVGSAKIRVHRARRRLKEALENQCAFYRDNEGVFRCDRKK